MANESTASEEKLPATGEDFAALLDETLGAGSGLEGTVIQGKIIAIDDDSALVDVGLKSEGRVSIKEFSVPGQPSEVKIGDVVEVYLERMEDRNGEAVLSREKARREEAWMLLAKAFDANERVNGTIFGRVKGGFTVDLSGAVAFLPGSQVDVRPVRDVGPLMGSPQPFQILKMDRRRGNIVVSRRAVLEESRAEARAELMASLKEGQVLEGVVKNITDYGAFVDLGGVDGLLHVTDIAWRRINHPSEALNVGQTVNVQVIRFNHETQRISLGMKQLEADPWDGVESKFPAGTKFLGRVTNITDYGAFVELEPGVEGLVHVSEMSWTKKNVYPGKIISTSQEVEVMVLEVDPQKRRISLGLKQCKENPWQEFVDTYAVGAEIEGQVKNLTEFGLFIELPGEIDGMVHLSDLDWARLGDEAIKDYNKGDITKVKVLEVDVEKERISLGIKQLTDDPAVEGMRDLKKGMGVTCTVTAVLDNGLEVSVGDGAHGFIRRADLARDRSEQRLDRYAKGDRFDAQITSVDSKDRKLSLSIKALEVSDEKKAMAEFGSSDSGASLGHILGAAMNKKAEEEDEAEETTAEEAPPEEAAEEAPAEEPVTVDAVAEAPEPAEEKKKPTAKKAKTTKAAKPAKEEKSTKTASKATKTTKTTKTSKKAKDADT